MAGGKLGEIVPCMVCLGDNVLTKATRIVEGQESDQYRCEAGHDFGMDYLKGPATESMWPPPPELVAMTKPR